MRALTVKAPWAWAILHAGKDVENRSWSTSYRGPLAIHAAVGCSRDYYAWATAWMANLGVETPALDTLSRGCVMGYVDVIDCVRESDRLWGMADNWHWLLANPRSCEPRFVRGSLGLWTLSE